MTDETADISTHEYVSLSIRWVNDTLEVHKDFLGFFETGETTAEELFNIVRDVSTRCGLDFIKCRGQGFDGVTNVSGIRNASLKSAMDNYSELLEFLQMKAEEDRTEAGAKANGFCSRLETRIQASRLSLQQAASSVYNLRITAQCLRNSFDMFWIQTKELAHNVSIEKPVLPRTHRVPKRLGGGNGEQHRYGTAEDF
ncbi:UNVERIFIED_CONTAM: hypothetical protein FKN15_059252 [Acipenser sinensis]